MPSPVPTRTGRRLIVVSNRAPYTIQGSGREASLKLTVGGLVTALEPLVRTTGGRWIAWLPDDLAPYRDRFRELPFQLVGVRLRPWEVKNYYYGFANRALWPIAHSLPSRAQILERHWHAYRYVNRKFAVAALRAARPGDTIWVHDYQLARVPLEIRSRSCGARVGFFLHVPFPPPRVFRRIPWTPEIVKGMLGADLVGFHTRGYAENFLEAASGMPEAEVEEGWVHWEGRDVRVGAFPIGIDFDRLETAATSPKTRQLARRIRSEMGAEILALGVDRLDYTKGIPERLLAVERALGEDPSLIGRLVLAQIAVPSRTHIREYRVIRREIERIVERVNRRFSRDGWSPIRYLPHEVPFEDLIAYYVASDVALVTPLRDGMNLVAKEYAACRRDGDGTLILSRFAGAAEEMPDAHLVDPKDVAGMARTLIEAIREDVPSRRRRMEAMRSRVRRNDLRDWLAGFLGALPRGSRVPQPISLPGLREATSR